MPPDRPEGVWGEIAILREWRHKVDTDLAARRLLLDSLGGRTAALEERLTKVEERMDAMIEADKIGKAVASAMQRQRGGVLTRRQRWVAYIVALVTVAAGIVSIVHSFLG